MRFRSIGSRAWKWCCMWLSISRSTPDRLSLQRRCSPGRTLSFTGTCGRTPRPVNAGRGHARCVAAHCEQNSESHEGLRREENVVNCRGQLRSTTSAGVGRSSIFRRYPPVQFTPIIIGANLGALGFRIGVFGSRQVNKAASRMVKPKVSSPSLVDNIPFRILIQPLPIPCFVVREFFGHGCSNMANKCLNFDMPERLDLPSRSVH